MRFMEETQEYLSKNPITGILCTLLGYSVQYIDHLSPLLKFITLFLSVLVGAATLISVVYKILLQHQQYKKNLDE